jgi:hypothetical protein
LVLQEEAGPESAVLVIGGATLSFSPVDKLVAAHPDRNQSKTANNVVPVTTAAKQYAPPNFKSLIRPVNKKWPMLRNPSALAA